MSRSFVEKLLPDKLLVALINIGHSARKEGMVNQSERLFQHLSHAYPLRAFPHIGIAMACMERGHYPRACTEFEQAMQNGGEGADLYIWAAFSYYQCGRYDKVVEHLRSIDVTDAMSEAYGVKEMKDLLLEDARIARLYRK
jgi:tetratricopeptide (TPR) repeat protein